MPHLTVPYLTSQSPGSRGDLPTQEVASTRRRWYASLAKTERQAAEFEALAQSGGATPLVDTRRPPQHREEQRRYSRKQETRAALVAGA